MSVKILGRGPWTRILKSVLVASSIVFIYSSNESARGCCIEKRIAFGIASNFVFVICNA